MVGFGGEISFLGLMSIKCHEKFKNSMGRMKTASKVGFSEECPSELAMGTMTQGMDTAIMLNQLGNPKWSCNLVVERQAEMILGRRLVCRGGAQPDLLGMTL